MKTKRTSGVLTIKLGTFDNYVTYLLKLFEQFQGVELIIIEDSGHFNGNSTVIL